MPTADPFEEAARLDGVASAVAAARDGVDSLLRDRGWRPTRAADTAESLLRGAAASGLLEGSQTGLDDLRAGRADPIGAGAARLNAELLSLVPLVGRAPLQAFARMHSIAAAGTVEDDLLGRPRPDADAAARLHGLARALTSPTSAPAIVVAGVAHAELATTAPFASMSGLVGRAAERLLLVARGVDPVSVTVPEAGHLALAPDYRSALQAYAEAGPVGVRVWLLHCCSAMTAGLGSSPVAADH